MDRYSRVACIHYGNGGVGQGNTHQLQTTSAATWRDCCSTNRSAHRSCVPSVWGCDDYADLDLVDSMSRPYDPLVKIRGKWALAPDKFPKIEPPTNPGTKCKAHTMSEWRWDPISNETVQRCLVCGENGRVLR